MITSGKIEQFERHRFICGDYEAIYIKDMTIFQIGRSCSKFDCQEMYLLCRAGLFFFQNIATGHVIYSKDLSSNCMFIDLCFFEYK